MQTSKHYMMMIRKYYYSKKLLVVGTYTAKMKERHHQCICGRKNMNRKRIADGVAEKIGVIYFVIQSSTYLYELHSVDVVDDGSQELATTSNDDDNISFL